MREEIRKVLFVGTKKVKETFFVRSQIKGIIHFIDPSEQPTKNLPQEVLNITAAMKILRSLPPHEQEENFSTLNATVVVENILNLHEKWLKIEEKIRICQLEISRISILGNFSLDDIKAIEKEGKCKIQFFCARTTLFDEQEEPEELLYVSSEHGLSYYMAINQQSVSYERMSEIKIRRSLDDWKQQLVESQKQYHQLESQLKQYEKYNQFLHEALIEKLDHYHLYHTQTYVQAMMEDSLFAIEGWVPQDKMVQVEDMLQDIEVMVEEIAIEPTDIIPTYLENHGAARIGEDLVNIYDTPSATDKDPSRWVLWFFTLFFAFIIGDAGYGLVYLGIALFLRYKYPNLKRGSKRMLNLFTILGVGCVVWGTLMTSFFGMQIGLDNPIRSFSIVQWMAEKKVLYHLKTQDETFLSWIQQYPELVDRKDVHEFVSFQPSTGKEGLVLLNRLTDSVMFELALLIGVVHLILSLCRYVGRNWPNSGWIVFLIGAYLYFPSYLKTPSILNYMGGIELAKGGVIGLELMALGIGVAWVGSIIRHGWTGIFEIMVLIQIFADTLSYLRLYALGLAGAIVGSTINEIASTLPLLLSVLLILISHAINIMLDTMSGVIHGLRLNFLEWYHYSFEGGGKQFQPLKLLKRE
jgi:V/A-type H+-transporting ATPase subunit I